MRRRDVGSSLFSKLLAVACGAFSIFAILVPWRLRPCLAYRLRAVIYWLEARFAALLGYYRRLTGEQEKALAAAHPAEHLDTQQDLPEGDSVAVLFSGGTDSTLAAVLLADKFKTLHLCTFRSRTTHSHGEAAARAQVLVDRFGEERIKHVFVDFDDIVRDVYYRHFWRDVRKWGIFKANICGACKAAMTIGAVRYCKEHDIRYLATGANREPGTGEFFIGQMPATVPLFEAFLAKHDIVSLAPVYHLLESEKTLHAMGIIDDWKGAKLGSIIEGAAMQEAMKNRGQVGCDQDVLTTIHNQGYCIPLKGYERFQELSVNFTRDLLDEFGEKWLGVDGAASS